MSFPRVSARFAVFVLLAVLLRPAAVPAAQRGLEYEVKAAYLYNIISFVTWPPDAFAGAADPIRVCVFGADPFGPLLDKTLEGGVADRRPMTAERVGDAEGIARCHLVFVPLGSADRTDQVLRATASHPILTVGESPDFLRRGGMIAFVIDGGRVRFDVNAPAATTRGLTLSSRLLQVARSVIGKGQRS